MDTDDLRPIYESFKGYMTLTGARVAFLKHCLDHGMSKREAAHRLVDVDTKISRPTAETIAYTNFSGLYRDQRTRRLAVPPASVIGQPDVQTEDDLL
jgi:hypothetical protein